MSSKKRMIVVILVILLVLIVSFSRKQLQSTMISIDSEKTLEAFSVTQIEIKTTVTKVNLFPSTDDRIHVQLRGEINRFFADELTLKAETENEEALIEVEAPKNFSNVDLSKHQLEIGIPKRVYEKITVESNLGDLQVNQVDAEKLQLSVNQGSIAVNEASGKELKLETNVGNISTTGVTGEVKAETDQGSILLNMKEITQDITIKGEVSEINLLSKQYPDSFRLSLQSEEGSVKADLPDLNYVTKSEHQVVASKGNGGPVIKIKTEQGTISLAK